MSEPYDDFDRALLRSGKEAQAPTARMRSRALRAAATAGVATGAALTATKLASATKAGFFAKALEVAVTFKWVVAATVATASVGTAVYVHEVASTERTLAPAPMASSLAVGTTTGTTSSTARVAPFVAPAPPAPTVAEVVEEAPPPPQPPVARPLSPPAPARVAVAGPSTAIAPVNVPSAAAPPAPPPSTLADELAILDAARGAIARGDSAQARRLTDEHARRFPAGHLAVERDALRARIAKMSNP